MQTEENAVPQEDVTPTEEQAQQPAETTSESGTETPTETTEATPEHAPKTWAERRIDKLTWEKNEERRQREALEAQLRQYQQPTDQPKPVTEQLLTAEQIRAEAKRLLEQERFDTPAIRPLRLGKKNFPILKSLCARSECLVARRKSFLRSLPKWMPVTR